MNIAALGLALLIGVVAGSRTLLAPAAVAWAVLWGRLDARGGCLVVFAQPWARWIWSALALGELVTDQLPFTPSRTVPFQFGGRVAPGGASGGGCGAGAAPAASGGLGGGGSPRAGSAARR